jgi:hypothetical protein
MKLPLLITGHVLSLLLIINASAAVHEGKWPEEKAQPAKVAPKQAAPVLQKVQQSAAIPTAPKQNHKQNNTAAYLGLGVDILPQSVSAQMPPGVSTGEGIIVTRFADDSPAKKSGLAVYDILLSYDDTKLVHPKQFIDLVRKDKPGRVVKLKVLRNGKVVTHPVTLGMQEVPQQQNQPNGLAIKQLGNNLYQANIRFTDANGNQQLRQYKGTRQEIYNQALNARDLPPKDREQILYASGGPKKGQSNNNRWGSFFPFGNKKHGGSFFPFGNKNNSDRNNRFGSFFPF